MLSRSTSYAFQALTYLAAQPPGKLTGAREIALSTGTPMPFLWKILRNLSRGKLIRSSKGVRGGYELARSAKRISVLEVIALTQGEDLANRCVLDSGDCNEHHPCLLHEAWKDVRDSIQTSLGEATIADLHASANTPANRKPRKKH